MKRILSLLPVLLFLTFTTANAAADREQRFHTDMARQHMLNARNSADFQEAAASLRKLSAKNPDGHVFYNLGTCLLLAGRHEEAVRAFSRAERYLGTSPDIRQNLRLAIQRSSAGSNNDLAWYRIPLFWHYMLPFSTRRDIAILAFCVFWLALLLNAVGAKQTSGLLLTVALVLIMLFGSSTLTSLAQERQDRNLDLSRLSLTQPETGVKP